MESEVAVVSDYVELTAWDVAADAAEERNVEI
jgi:hypothetical protein